MQYRFTEADGSTDLEQPEEISDIEWHILLNSQDYDRVLPIIFKIHRYSQTVAQMWKYKGRFLHIMLAYAHACNTGNEAVRKTYRSIYNVITPYSYPTYTVFMQVVDHLTNKDFTEVAKLNKGTRFYSTIDKYYPFTVEEKMIWELLQ